MYSIENHKKNFTRLGAGEITTAAEWQALFAEFLANEAALTAELSGIPVAELKKMAAYGNRYDRKADLIRSRIEGWLVWYALDQEHGFWPMGGPGPRTQREAVEQAVAKITDAAVQAYVAGRKAEQAAIRKSLTNPETLEELEYFVAHVRGGEARLSDDQLAAFDALRADAWFKQNAAEMERRAAVEKVDLGDVEFRLREDVHSKKNCKIWVVGLSERVDRELYKELAEKADKFGGHWSSWGPKERHGFIFWDEDDAAGFMGLTDGDGSVMDRWTRRETGRRERAAARLSAAADSRASAADSSLSAERKVNTVRRAMMAESAERRARGQQREAGILEAVSEALEQNRLRFLARLRFVAQVEALESALQQAKYRAIRAANDNRLPETEADRSATLADIRHAALPEPYLTAWEYDRLKEKTRGRRGTVRLWALAARRDDAGPQAMVCFKDRWSAQAARDLVAMAGWTNELGRWDDVERFWRMGIDRPEVLRAALREYLQFRPEISVAVNAVKLAEYAVVGLPIAGYFPTPPELADRVVEMADIRGGMRVLEPSAGKGSLAERVRVRHPDAVVDCVEPVDALRHIIAAKGFPLVGGDILEYAPGEIYDRAVLNPPFEAKADLVHVRHVFDLLKPGGRLVAIMSGPTATRGDDATTTFRAWVEELGGTFEAMPEGTFKSSDRPTGVATCLLLLDKPAERKSGPPSPQESEPATAEVPVMAEPPVMVEASVMAEPVNAPAQPESEDHWYLDFDSLPVWAETGTDVSGWRKYSAAEIQELLGLPEGVLGCIRAGKKVPFDELADQSPAFRARYGDHTPESDGEARPSTADLNVTAQTGKEIVDVTNSHAPEAPVGRSQLHKGVRDWSVSARYLDKDSLIRVTFKTGRTTAQEVEITPAEWPALRYDQTQLVLRRMGASPDNDGFCQQTRLADEAVRAVSEVMQGRGPTGQPLAIPPAAPAALVPWQVSSARLLEAVLAGKLTPPAPWRLTGLPGLLAEINGNQNGHRDVALATVSKCVRGYHEAEVYTAFINQEDVPPEVLAEYEELRPLQFQVAGADHTSDAYTAAGDLSLESVLNRLGYQSTSAERRNWLANWFDRAQDIANGPRADRQEWRDLVRWMALLHAGDLAPDASLAPWQLTCEDYVRAMLSPEELEKRSHRGEAGAAYSGDAERAHAASVRSALQAGADVPPAVRAEYPDLVAAADPRQPWQMTCAEYLAPIGRLPHGFADRGWRVRHAGGIDYAIAPDGAEFTLGKSPDDTDEVTLYRAKNPVFHENAVEQAVLARAAVPPEVLADYPRLMAMALGWQPWQMPRQLYCQFAFYEFIAGGERQSRISKYEAWFKQNWARIAPDYDAERETSTAYINDRPVHRLIVMQALAQGQTVPPEVLADYPALEAKPEPPAPPTSPTPAEPTVPAEPALTTDLLQGGDRLTCISGGGQMAVMAIEPGGCLRGLWLDTGEHRVVGPDDLARYFRLDAKRAELKRVIVETLRREDGPLSLETLCRSLGYSYEPPVKLRGQIDAFPVYLALVDLAATGQVVVPAGPVPLHPMVGLPGVVPVAAEPKSVAKFQADGSSPARNAALDWVQAHTDTRLYPESQELVLGAGMAYGHPAYRLADGNYVRFIVDDHAGRDPNGLPNGETVCWVVPIPGEQVGVHPHLIAFWQARGYPAVGPVNFEAAPPAETITPPASGTEPRSAFPLGQVGAEDESRYYGTRVTVLSHGETVKTHVFKVHNGGSLLEVHNPLCPGDLFATFRVSGEQVLSVDDLIDRKATPDAPLPQPTGVPPLVAQLQHMVYQWGGDANAAERVIFQKFAGDANRRLRHELMTALTGKSRPVSECGVTALLREYLVYLARQTEAPETPAPAQPETLAAPPPATEPPPAATAPQCATKKARRTKEKVSPAQAGLF